MNNTTKTHEGTSRIEEALFLAGCIAEASKAFENSGGKATLDRRNILIHEAKTFLKHIQKLQDEREEKHPDYDEDLTAVKAAEIIEDVLSRQRPYFRY